jgi:hypothetical protein
MIGCPIVPLCCGTSSADDRSSGWFTRPPKVARRYDSDHHYCVGVLMLWWILIIVVALVVIGWGVRRSRAGKARHPDQTAIKAQRNSQEGRGFGLGGRPTP